MRKIAENRLHTDVYRAIMELNQTKRRTKMARIISDECISCGACAANCPVSAIAEGDGKYEINPNECIDCGACEAGCPVSAISEE
jgi:ferredoxin